MIHALLRLECICDHYRHIPRGLRRIMFPNFLAQLRKDEPWVAELTDINASGQFVRAFLRGARDYHQADELGERGIFKNFYLHEGVVYEVNAQLSWISHRRYFCHVQNGRIVEMTKDEVETCLSAR